MPAGRNVPDQLGELHRVAGSGRVLRHAGSIAQRRGRVTYPPESN